MKDIIVVLKLFCLVVCVSCTEKKCDEIEIHSNAVKYVNGPDTVQLGEEFDYNVIYSVIDGCWSFETFEVQRVDTVFSVDLRVQEKKCEFCTSYAASYAELFKFQISEPGVYVIKFGTNEVKDTLVVE